jgi:hypothetical protein
VERLRVVFQRLWEYDLLLNLFSSFVQKKVEFLNHIISETSAKTLLKHLEAIQAFLWPLDIRDLQGFLGLVNFYLRFIAATARILLTLTSAYCSRKKVQIEWSPQMKATLGLPRQLFAGHIAGTSGSFSHHQLGLPHLRHSCAAAVLRGLAASVLLKQKQDDVQKYSTIDSELQVAYLAIRHFRFLSRGDSFTLKMVTNPSPLISTV